MNTKGLFLGARRIEYDEKTNEQGIKIPAFKGWQYSFYGNDWKKGLLLTGNGIFLNMTLREDEEQPKELIVGEIFDLKITNLDSRKCVLLDIEEEDNVELPY